MNLNHANLETSLCEALEGLLSKAGEIEKYCLTQMPNISSIKRAKILSTIKSLKEDVEEVDSFIKEYLQE